MRKFDVIYRFLIDYYSLALSNAIIPERKKFKNLFRKIFIKTYFLKFSQKKPAVFLDFKVDYFNYKDFYFLSRDIIARLEYAIDLNNSKPLIIDCGSNIGISILFFKYLYPDSEIHGFEPDPSTFKLLENNILSNNIKNVTINNLALSENNGIIDFYIDKSHPGSLIMSTLFDRQPKDKIQVNCIKLSDYLKNLNYKNIDLLKIDVEGAEHEVFKDLIENNIISNVKNIILEYHHNIKGSNPQLGKLLNILENQGFNYQISAYTQNYLEREQYQDFMIYLYK